ncbi:MAG TPA: LemA family protein [Candidatus Polarisedimenticolaceae bacterium]|nr:LemA family protein [Candidatus Polarisedimenticolaceae bacterium]
MSRNSSSKQRGAIKTGCAVAAGVVVLLVVIVALTTVGRYNNLVTLQESVEAAWSEIDNQYKRRYDLIPQLVSTVQGAADFEKSTLEAVTEARASVGRAQLQSYVEAQQGLSAALGRLFVVVERYPDIKANQNFLSLQDQLEGTENRIAVARRDYIDRVRQYNTYRRRFPSNLVAGLLGFDAQPQLEIDAGERETPQVEFDFGSDDGS